MDDPRRSAGGRQNVGIEAGEAIGKKNGDSNRNGLVSIIELTGYLTTRVPGLTDGRQRPGIEVRFESDVFAAGL